MVIFKSELSRPRINLPELTCQTRQHTGCVFYVWLAYRLCILFLVWCTGCVFYVGVMYRLCILCLVGVQAVYFILLWCTGCSFYVWLVYRLCILYSAWCTGCVLIFGVAPVENYMGFQLAN